MKTPASNAAVAMVDARTALHRADIKRRRHHRQGVKTMALVSATYAGAYVTADELKDGKHRQAVIATPKLKHSARAITLK